MSRINKNIQVENARILFRNFSGKEGKFNPAGQRNFCTLINPEIADELKEDGWNIRWLTPKEEGDAEIPYLPVKVCYKNIPPKIVLISSKGKTILDETTVNILDWAEIENVDLIIRPYNWEVSGKTGIKGYVKTMYVTIAEDEFESKYEDVPTSAASDSMEE